MKVFTALIMSTFFLATVASASGPSGLSLQPVRTVTANAGNITILGNMPLPANVPPDQRQLNQVIYPASADHIGCGVTAQQAIGSSKTFTIIGNVTKIYAVKGIFTMEMDSVQTCVAN